MTTLLPQWLAETRVVCDGATPGPWAIERRVGTKATRTVVVYASGDICTLYEWARPDKYRKAQGHDAAFIAAARTALPRALTIVEAALAWAKMRLPCEAEDLTLSERNLIVALGLIEKLKVNHE